MFYMTKGFKQSWIWRCWNHLEHDVFDGNSQQGKLESEMCSSASHSMLWRTDHVAINCDLHAEGLPAPIPICEDIISLFSPLSRVLSPPGRPTRPAGILSEPQFNCQPCWSHFYFLDFSAAERKRGGCFKPDLWPFDPKSRISLAGLWEGFVLSWLSSQGPPPSNKHSAHLSATNINNNVIQAIKSVC